MDFKSATDALFTNVTADDLASCMGMSIQSVRQARSDEKSTGFRHPPGGWENAVRKVAEKQIRHYERLLAKL